MLLALALICAKLVVQVTIIQGCPSSCDIAAQAVNDFGTGSLNAFTYPLENVTQSTSACAACSTSSSASPGTSSTSSTGSASTSSSACTVDFTNNILPWLQTSAIGGHVQGAASGGLSFDGTASTVYSTLLGSANSAGCASWNYIVPFSTANSFLYQKLKNPPCGSLMPLGASSALVSVAYVFLADNSNDRAPRTIQCSRRGSTAVHRSAA
jgi:hypothetical protein